MNGLPDSVRFGRQVSLKLGLIMALSVCLIPDSPVKAENIVYVDVARSGAVNPVDTLYSGGSYDFRIWIENDSQLRSFLISLKNWASTSPLKGGEPNRGVNFTWENVQGYGPSGLNTGHACVTVEPGSRMDPPNFVWDYGSGFRVWEHDLNEISPDSIGFGGNSLSNGLQPGSLQHMVSIHFKPTTLSLNVIYMHLDSAFISLGGGMIFFDAEGIRITPQFTSSAPWKLKAMCGDANGDGQANVADAVFLIQYIFRGGPAPKPTIVANVNGDEEVNVGDVVYLIGYIFNQGPGPDCQ